MALPNPIYIGQNALHTPASIRLLAYGLTTGVQGVLGTADCAIKALGTPGAAVQAMPGAYMVRAKHLASNYEGYAGKFDVAEQVTVSPTTSSGGRSDLVILVIKDPYVSGAGSWATPTGQAAIDGPYAFIEVIEGVASTTWDIAQRPTEGGWSAITLARITRPASTGIVQQSHITDLRSLATLGGTRTVIIDNPPVTPPPIAQSSYVQFKPSARDANYPSSDTVHNYLNANTTATQSWPAAATWDVPIPSWATSMDIDAAVYGAQILNGDIFGEIWMTVNGSAQAPLTVALDYGQVPARHTIPYGGTFAVPSSIRGRVVTFRLQMRHYYNGPGRMDAKAGTTSRLNVFFQRYPD
ncbi:hypothetical protein EV383_4377 [Pseudonocardia sediminis]|uniref:Uncharacterized protein n=1 Tax=Pseudonocardia sediminis TaxID=1397368 RepID=A0A4Q7V414_PSEST|nr:hypothetical protein [Pseudonocardia sediminis]RZT87453.1 hypothetical protein EV383_4377 [Pseudonocardia sediminis]